MSNCLPYAIEEVRPSVVQILTNSTDGRGQVIGTGFFIHPDGYLLTAKHVISDVPPSADGTINVSIGLAMPNISTPQLTLRQGFEHIQCTVVQQDPRHDLALLQAEHNPFASGRPSGIHRNEDGSVGINGLYGLATLAPTRPRDGEEVAVSGYPLSAATLITTRGVIASAWASDIADIIPKGSAHGFTMPDVKDAYLADIAVNPGNSGGPVYLSERGHVIGVCVAFQIAEARDSVGNPLRYNSGLSIIVPIQYGIELLTHHISTRPEKVAEEG